MIPHPKQCENIHTTSYTRGVLDNTQLLIGAIEDTIGLPRHQIPQLQVYTIWAVRHSIQAHLTEINIGAILSDVCEVLINLLSIPQSKQISQITTQFHSFHGLLANYYTSKTADFQKTSIS